MDLALALVVQADLASVEEGRRAAKEALDAWGTMDILVNNAGIGCGEPILEASMESFDRVIAINLRAPLLLTQLLAPGMIAQRRGKIINISSQAAMIGLLGHATYRQLVQLGKLHTQSLSPQEQAMVLGENALHVFETY